MTSPTHACADCGSVPAPHWKLWIDNVSDAITLQIPLHDLPLYSRLIAIADTILSFVGRLTFFALRALHVITLSDDITTSPSDRSKFLWEEARRRSINMKHLMIFGTPTDMFWVRHNGRSEFFQSLPLSPESHALRMDDKVLFKERMRQGGLPVPKSFGVSSLSEARARVREIGSACIKPRTGSNGRHTYPNVHTDEQVASAYKGVKQIGPFVTVEEFLEGNLCRATCVDGTLIGFLESAYPTIVGDGVSTIAELIQVANTRKVDGVSDIILDSSVLDFVKRRGYTPESVLPAGEKLALTYRGGTGSGGSNREHGRGGIHPSFIEPIEKAAKLTELTIVGFDIIIPDAQQPADSQKWGFIESNSLPWIDLHMQPFYGEPVDLTPAVWDAWLRKSKV